MALSLRWKTLAQAYLVIVLSAVPCYGQIRPNALSQHFKPIAPNQEYKAKANFLFNFAKFTTWPKDLLAKDDRFQLCILGSDPFGLFLDILAIRDVRGHKVDLLRLKPGDDVEGCHLLFLANDAFPEEGRLPEELARRGLFVVADTPGSAERGAIVNLLHENGNVRFEINVEAARRAALILKTQLLRLGRLITNVESHRR